MGALLLVAVLAAFAAAGYAWVFFRRYYGERAEHRRVVALFSRYVPPPVVADLLARRDPRLFSAREYYATVVHCRIRNFALFTESLSPEETLQYLNEFYTIVGKATQRHRGMIESLRGDTVVAVFGVLLEETFQEERALRASLDVMRMVKAMESRWAEQNRRAFTVGIGVNSGKIVAGDTGFEHRREFAIVGNPADVAARLEQASEELNATVVASEKTYDVVRELFVGVPTSSLPLPGLRRLHSAYIIRGLTKRATEDRKLTLPSQRAFARTVVENDEDPLERVVAEPVPDPMPPQPSRVDAARAPANAVDERSSASAIVERPSYSFKGIEPSKQRFSSFDADEPALPEPPAAASTYEDDQGPPVQLPP
ncbi:MAG TPA: adenylate/guanylate cyclase domain-containing protein [Candidatus Acidoferrales bacterium]|nr:adenylate/guanylate cyclase domain-containing protein [Candidatus Acidoferrales bacterium]